MEEEQEEHEEEEGACFIQARGEFGGSLWTRKFNVESPEILHRARNQSKGIYPIVFLLLELIKATKENGRNGLFFAAFCYNGIF